MYMYLRCFDFPGTSGRSAREDFEDLEVSLFGTVPRGVISLDEPSLWEGDKLKKDRILVCLLFTVEPPVEDWDDCSGERNGFSLRYVSLSRSRRSGVCTVEEGKTELEVAGLRAGVVFTKRSSSCAEGNSVLDWRDFILQFSALNFSYTFPLNYLLSGGSPSLARDLIALLATRDRTRS